MCLGGIPRKDVVISNVYASTNVKTRCSLWEFLLENLPKDFRWLLCRDYNFVKQASNKSNINGKIILVEKKQVFSLLIDAHKVEDKFLANNMLRFSWENKKKDRDKHLARIDKHYTFNQVGIGMEVVSKYYIKGN